MQVGDGGAIALATNAVVTMTSCILNGNSAEVKVVWVYSHKAFLWSELRVRIALASLAAAFTSAGPQSSRCSRAL